MRVSAGFLVIGWSGKTRMYTLPSFFTWRVIATRAASIWRAVMRPHSAACKPKSPNETASPPLARPVIRPFIRLRNLVRLGASMRRLQYLSHGWRRGPSSDLQHLAVEDPALHADRAVRRARLGKPVVDVGPQGVQGDPPLAVPLAARHLGPAQPARRGDADALGAELHGGL